MSNNQHFERLCGVGTTLLGFLALAYAIFGPIYQGVSSSGQSGTANMFQMGIQPVTLVAFGIFLLALLGVAVGAVLHSRGEENKWRIVLGGSTLVISVFTILTLPSIGLFMLPCILLALVATVLSSPAAKVALG